MPIRFIDPNYMVLDVMQQANGSYTLFWEALSGAMVVELVLEELGISYELTPVDMAAGEHKSARYLALNPTGQVPALALPDGRVIGESAAIILTIGEQNPGNRLIPDPSDACRPAFLRWLIYMAASPYMTFVQFNHPERFLTDPSVHAGLVENAKDRLMSQFTLLENAVDEGPFFFGSEIGALDLYLFMLIEFFPDHETLFAGREKLRLLHSKVLERDSARTVLARHR